MCDFSLELYRSRPARVGERYETRRFPGGTVGFIAPGAVSTAVCMASDTHLRLEEISQVVQNACGVMADEDVTFTRLEIGQFHDGVRFANGAQVTLQRLGPGVKGYVIDALLSPLWAPEMAEVCNIGHLTRTHRNLIAAKFRRRFFCHSVGPTGWSRLAWEKATLFEMCQ